MGKGDNAGEAAFSPVPIMFSTQSKTDNQISNTVILKAFTDDLYDIPLSLLLIHLMTSTTWERNHWLEKNAA